MLDLPHRQFVFAIPKALRLFIRHDRGLFFEVSRLIYRLIQDFYREAAGTELIITTMGISDFLASSISVPGSWACQTMETRISHICRCSSMFGATIYLYDVEPGGGSFFYWPDSHHAAHRYFREHPEHVDGSFLKQEGYSWNVFCDNPETGGREFAAKAGDVVLWHAYLTHAGSINVRNSPRIALFARWYH